MNPFKGRNMESGRMDLDSAEANGNVKKTPVATYKALPDDDSARQDVAETVAMGKPNNENEIDDGVHEKMLKDESKISPTKDTTEVHMIMPRLFFRHAYSPNLTRRSIKRDHPRSQGN